MAKYGYRDITDVVFEDLSTGLPVIFMDYLQTASQTYGNEVVYIKGSRGAPKLLGFQSDSSMEMELTSALITPEMLGIMFGTAVTTGSTSAPRTELITATSNTFDLASTPVVDSTHDVHIAYCPDGTVPSVNLTKVVGTPTATEFSITGQTITANSSTYSSGGVFLATYYKTTSATNKRVKFQSDGYTKAYKVKGYTLWKSTTDELMYPCMIEIPKLQIEIGGSTLASVMNGEATTIKFKGQALKTSANTDLVIFDIDEGSPITV